jgi:hypothetical protein
MNEVITIVTTAGEIIGRFLSEDAESITLENPRAIMMQEAGAGFAPGVCLSGERDPKEITFSKAHVIFKTKTSDPISKSWMQLTSGIIL